MIVHNTDLVKPKLAVESLSLAPVPRYDHWDVKL